MIDWSSSEYKRNNNAFTAGVRWLSIDCYDGNDALPFVQSNQTSSSNDDKRRGRRGAGERSADDDALRLWARQSQSVNSWVWGGASLASVLSSDPCLCWRGWLMSQDW